MTKKARFIWLRDQRIDHDAGFATLRGAPLRRDGEGTNRWILARRRFQLAKVPLEAAARITVDGRYKLWINGMRIGFGPVRSSPWFQRVDRHSIKELLRSGDNVVAVLVHVPGIDLAWYETVKGAWQPVFGDGGLYFELEGDANQTIIVSDEDWRMQTSPAWSRETPQAGWGQDFIEDFDARALNPDWVNVDFDDSLWPRARQMISFGDETQAARGWGLVEPFPHLVPSELPSPAERRVSPTRHIWTRPVVSNPDLPLERRLFDVKLGEPNDLLTDNASALLSNTGITVVRTREAHGTALLFAFDPYHVGRPYFDVEARGGEVIEIGCAELLPGEFGQGSDADGLKLLGELDCANVFRYTARPGRQRFEKFGWTAIRAMQVVIRNAPHGLRIHSLGSTTTHYPVTLTDSFECSDATLSRLWLVARHTLIQCMQDAWIDCPGREARQWVGDPIVAFDAAVLAFGSSIYPLHRQFLLQMAESQRQDGLLRMFAPGDISAEAITIPDFSLLWIIGADRYFQQAGDSETIKRIMPAIERSLAWFGRSQGPEGLISDLPHWHFIEWAHIDRRGQSAPVNALLAGAYNAAARLAQICQQQALAIDYRARACEIAEALNRTHWDEERGVFVDSVDPETGEQRRRVSQHANALMLLFGFVSNNRSQRVISAITDPGRLKLTAAPPIVPDGEEFDEEVDVVRANTFFAHFVNDGLARSGEFNWVAQDLVKTFGPMLATGTATLWESYQPAASLCHGFSSAPLYQLSTYALGVQAKDEGHARFCVAPQPAHLNWARGTVPTKSGPIKVEWELENDKLEINVMHPENCHLEPSDVVGFSLVEAQAQSTQSRLVYSRK